MRTTTASRLLIATLTLLTLSATANWAGSATIVYQSTVLANNPVAFWRLGEGGGTTMVDQTGNGHNGTYSNVALGATGVGPGSDTAGTFNGTNSSSSVPDSPAFDLLDFTLEAWVKLDSNPTDANLRVLNQQDGGGYWLLHISQAGVGDWRLTAYASIDGINGAMRGPNLIDGQFHQIVLTRDTVNDLFSFYVDGALAGPTIPITSNVAYALNANVFLGSAAGSGQFFPGIIDEAVIYNVALTAAQIQENFVAASTPPVPEPSTFALLSLGGLGLAWRARRRRS